MAAREKGREPRAASLLVSVVFHVLAGLGVAASSWWWGAPMQEAWKTHTVSLVDAPLSLQQPVTVPPAALPKAPSLPTAEVETPAPPEVSSPPEPAAKTPTPSPKLEAAKLPPESKDTSSSRAKSTPAKPASNKSTPDQAASAKPVPAKPVPDKPTQALQAATSQEARSAIEALRQRQVKHDQEKQSEATRQQAASARIDALRDQLEQQETVGGAAIMAAGVQRVRLMAYQDRVRAKII